jgi:hypothetical protein
VTDFSDAFVRIAAERLGSVAAEAYAAVAADPLAFDPLDARQLLKHFLAGKRRAVENDCKVILLHLFWTPANADAFPVFKSDAWHRSSTRADAPPTYRAARKRPDIEFARSNLAIPWSKDYANLLRTRRSMRRTGPVVVPHRRLPNLREHAHRRECRLQPRPGRTAP